MEKVLEQTKLPTPPKKPLNRPPLKTSYNFTRYLYGTEPFDSDMTVYLDEIDEEDNNFNL